MSTVIVTDLELGDVLQEDSTSLAAVSGERRKSDVNVGLRWLIRSENLSASRTQASICIKK